MRTRRKLKSWVKAMLWFIFGVIMGIAFYQLFTEETIKSTPVGTYTCNGGIIKICSGSAEVANYLE